MGMLDINYFPYFERMKEKSVESGERLDEALKYIDFIVGTLLRYQTKMTPERIRRFIRDGENQWNKLVGQELPVQLDDDGSELFLNSINFPEMFLGRVVGSAENDEQYQVLSRIAKNVAKFMGWGDLEIVEDMD